jgi:hypothetical protein
VNKWCTYKGADAAHIKLEFHTEGVFPSSYRFNDSVAFRHHIRNSFAKWVNGRTVAGRKIELVQNSDGDEILSFSVQDENSTITQLQERFGRVASFNIEFLVGGGIYSYLPVSTLRTAVTNQTVKENIERTISHEMCHSIMNLKSTQWSLTHKGTSTIFQDPLPDAPADEDICTYAPFTAHAEKRKAQQICAGKPVDTAGCKRFLETDLMWLVLSCAEEDSGSWFR